MTVGISRGKKKPAHHGGRRREGAQGGDGPVGKRLLRHITDGQDLAFTKKGEYSRRPGWPMKVQKRGLSIF